jgi:hypothetical protein
LENPKQCFHCKNVRPESEMKHATLTYRENRRNMSLSGWFCKDKPCQHHEQMTLEN